MSEIQSFIDRILLLKNAPFFELLRTDELKRIAILLTRVGWAKGERVFALGDPGDAMYLLMSGSIGISIDPNPERTNFIAKLGPGDCFGEMGVVDDLLRSATAHVLEDAKPFAWKKPSFTICCSPIRNSASACCARCRAVCSS